MKNNCGVLCTTCTIQVKLIINIYVLTLKIYYPILVIYLPLSFTERQSTSIVARHRRCKQLSMQSRNKNTKTVLFRPGYDWQYNAERKKTKSSDYMSLVLLCYRQYCRLPAPAFCCFYPQTYACGRAEKCVNVTAMLDQSYYNSGLQQLPTWLL